MQPLTKAVRRRLRRLDPTLTEREIDRFEEDSQAAMLAAMMEDPLYAAALEIEAAVEARADAIATTPVQVDRRLSALLREVAEPELQRLSRRSDSALARQAEAARLKRPLPQRAAASAAPGAAKQARAKKAASKKVAAKPARKPAAKKASRTASRPRQPRG